MTDYGSQRPYTPNSLADRWGCSAQTVRNLISEGRLRAFRVGRLFRIKPEAVEEYECRTSQLENCEAVLRLLERPGLRQKTTLSA